VNGLASTAIAPDREEQSYFRDVFSWMAAALAVSGAVAAAIGHSQTALNELVTGGGGWLYLVLIVIELLLVAGLVGLVQHMDTFTAAVVFLGYAALNGITLSVIFALFTTKSVFATFLVTAGMFGALALFGAFTNIDMTSWGSILGMMLFGQLIGLVVNLFWLNQTLYWVTTATGVLLFSVLTAYDVQKLKSLETDGEGQPVQKEAIVGSLSLYLDFVNLFLYLLRLFGRRR
jgi:uncharacterized protein